MVSAIFAFCSGAALPPELDSRSMTLARSSHYGWIARGLNAEIFAVVFQDDKQKPADPNGAEVKPGEPGEKK